MPPSLGREDTKTRLIAILQQLLVLSLAIFGFLFSLTTSYQLTILNGRTVLIAFLFVILFVIVYSSKRREVFLLISFLAALFWVWVNSDTFLQSMLVLVEQGLAPLSLNLPDFLQNQIQTYDAQQAIRLTTTGVQVVVFLTTLLSGYFVIHRSSMAGLALTTLPLLLPATFFSLAPAIVPFFCLAGAHIMLFIRSNAWRIPSFEAPDDSDSSTQKSQNSPNDNHTHQLTALLALPLIVFTALVSVLFLPQRGYERPERIEALQQKILSLHLGNIGQKSNDGLTRGNLRSLSNIRFTGDVVLKVHTTLESPFYLRDYVGAYFTNDGWSGVSDAYYAEYSDFFAGVAPQNLSADSTIIGGAQYQPYTLSVRNIDATPSSIWIPNGLLTTAGEISGAGYLQDAVLYFENSSDSDEYTLTAMTRGAVLTAIPLTEEATLKSAYLAAAGSETGLQGASGSDAQLLQSAAQAYIEYIFDVYTALPDDTQAAAEQLCETYGLSVHAEDDTLNLFETCHDLYSLLTTQCSYAYSPPKIPSGTDFTTYFLEESRQGYCVHFATSATVLLRSLGIPARYAEGYIVVGSDYDKQPDEDGYIDIEDTHAHAWVEVFDPAQLEWIPFEMTASASGSASATPDPDNTGDVGYAETPTPEPTPEPTPTPTEEPTPEPSEEPLPSDESESVETPMPDASESADSTPSAEETEDASVSSITPTPDPNSQDGSDEGDGAAQGGQSASAAGSVLWPFLVVLLSVGLLFVACSWRKANIKRLKRQLRQRNINASVLAVCRYALDMLRFAGCEPLQPLQTPEAYAEIVALRLPWVDHKRLQAILELAQLARFSDTVCTRQDWNEAAAFAAAIHAGLNARLPRLRRWIFKWRYPAL
jgi:transglutaminase-like putative cysteine protease